MIRSNFSLNREEYITMIKGDTLAFAVKLKDESGDVFSQDLDTAYFTCKSNKTDTVNVFQKSLNNGISKVETGIYRVRVAPADTQGVEAGRYYYDLQVGINGDVFTVLNGVIEIDEDVS